MESEHPENIEAQKNFEFPDFIDKKNLDTNLSFPLNEEKDGKGEIIPGRAFWIKLQLNGQLAEGKLYTPGSNNLDTLILFEPGMPGDSVKWVEEKHAKSIVGQGYTLIVMRHLGTKLNPEVESPQETDTRNKYIHCPQRIEKNPQDYSPIIGNLRNECKIPDMAEEAAVALNSLGKNFSNIKIIGHSFGTLFLPYSLNRLDPKVLDKITHFISLAGIPSGLDTSKLKTSDYKVYLQWCLKFIQMTNPEETLRAIEGINEEIKSKKLPTNVMLTMVQSPDDEFLDINTLGDSQAIFDKGLNITDLTQTEEDFHDLKNLRPETLLRLLNLPYVPRKKSNVTFSRKEPKK